MISVHPAGGAMLGVYRPSQSWPFPHKHAKPYQEDPAEFKPLTEDELQRIKKERRQKDLQRKQKAAENRKHLANVRVVQKNLVFVVGLSQRLADLEVLKKHEYFGKFGKIHKVVINQSTSYAGAQGPSASAYVTYNRPEDALRAIQAVNNIFVDGRTIKASLGTTKYCSHFLRGAQCPKPDCMYLHELGEEAASFTKEEMQQGKHQEYEQKLCDQYINNPVLDTPVTTVAPASTNTTSTTVNTVPITSKGQSNKRKTGSPPLPQQPHPPHHNNKDAWPSLSNNGNSKHDSGHMETNGQNGSQPPQTSKQDLPTNRNKQNSSQQANGKTKPMSPTSQASQPSPPLHTSSNSTEQLSPPIPSQPVASSVPPPRKVPFSLDNTDSSLSLFSSNGFPTVKNLQPLVQPTTHIPPEDSIQTTEISDSIPVSYATDWQAAFGFGSSSSNTDTHDDDLGFDPWRESSKALADLIEKEQVNSAYDNPTDRLKTVPPPGFSSNNFVSAFSNPHTEFAAKHQRDGLVNHIQKENSKDWQEGLRALLPNINISFGTPPSHPNLQQQSSRTQPQQFMQPSVPQLQHKNIPNSTPDLTWDPAIVSSGNVADQNTGNVEEPHWMASLQHLTEIDTPAPNNRFPYMQSFPFRAPTWGAQTQHPPPGFQNPVRAQAQFPETQKIAGGLQ